MKKLFRNLVKRTSNWTLKKGEKIDIELYKFTFQTTGAAVGRSTDFFMKAQHTVASYNGRDFTSKIATVYEINTFITM
jgi:hypothetical protein